jgi:hypothetical protein
MAVSAPDSRPDVGGQSAAAKAAWHWSIEHSTKPAVAILSADLSSVGLVLFAPQTMRLSPSG